MVFLIEEERKILTTTEETYVALYPKHSLGFKVAKFAVGRILGVVPRFFTMKALDSYSRSGFFNTVRENSEINPGEIKDIIEKWVKLKELTLTSRNFLFLYEKGIFSKQLKLIGLPLQDAKTVTSHENKSLTVYYEVAQEGKNKVRSYELQISVPNADNWVKEIQELINP